LGSVLSHDDKDVAQTPGYTWDKGWEDMKDESREDRDMRKDLG